MKTQSSDLSNPVKVSGRVQPESGRPPLPLSAKILYSLFVAVLIPVYVHEYGPTNFLYFCDVALLLTLMGLWWESPLLVSMCSVGILLPQFLWLVDFVCHAVGIHLTGTTDYMFDAKLPIFTRGLSLFHGWLPLVLVWLQIRLGYDRRALPAWTGLAGVLILVCYCFMPAAGAQLADPNTPVNINYVYGFDDHKPQQWVNPNIYVILWFGLLTTLAFIPTHLVLKRFCRPARAWQQLTSRLLPIE
jgi:hypothetical protein